MTVYGFVSDGLLTWEEVANLLILRYAQHGRLSITDGPQVDT